MKYIINIIILIIMVSASADGTDDHSHEQDNDQAHHDHSEESEGDHHDYAFGESGHLQNVDRTIEVIMSDNKYDLPWLGVSAGETIHFKIRNEGRLIHEFTIATTDMHIEHQDEMQNHISSGHMSLTDKGHGGGHDHVNSLLLNPGESGELIWTFAKAENLEFACNVPGHYQSGMVGAITVH